MGRLVQGRHGVVQERVQESLVGGTNTRGPAHIRRRTFLGAALTSGAALACRSAEARELSPSYPGGTARPVLVGSANALLGMKLHYADLVGGADPLDVAIDVVKVTEANEKDNSVGLGGLPNEDGVVQLDAACMHGPTHNAGAVGAIENILHPSEVARLVMERTDHCMIVGRGAYDFARMHGHPHTELLTEDARRIWLNWMEKHSEQDDRLPGRDAEKDERSAQAALAGKDLDHRGRITGTIHCSALATDGAIACTTTTSGLSWKIPGRIGDSPIIGAGLYCDQEAGSAGATGRGEAAILAGGSNSIVQLLRGGLSPVDAGLELLRRVVRQTRRMAAWQPALLDDKGWPSFGLQFYVLGLDGDVAGVTLRGGGKFAVSDPEGGPRLVDLTRLEP